jgi:hypothetical protein
MIFRRVRLTAVEEGTMARPAGFVLLAAIIAAAGALPARAGVAKAETDRFVQNVGQCQASQRGAALYQCVGDALQQMANGLQCGTARARLRGGAGDGKRRGGIEGGAGKA